MARPARFVNTSLSASEQTPSFFATCLSTAGAFIKCRAAVCIGEESDGGGGKEEKGLISEDAVENEGEVVDEKTVAALSSGHRPDPLSRIEVGSWGVCVRRGWVGGEQSMFSRCRSFLNAS